MSAEYVAPQPFSNDIDTAVYVRNGGVSLLLECSGPGLPRVAHWGHDLGDLASESARAVSASVVMGVPSSTIDESRRVGVVPELATGYAGRGALTGSAVSGRFSPMFTTTGVLVGPCVPTLTATYARESTGEAADQQVVIEAEDRRSSLQLRCEFRLSEHGVLRVRHRITNAGADEWDLQSLPVVLPVPAAATDLLDLGGRHLRERSPQRLPFALGAWVREQRRGRTGHDAPLLLVAGTAGFSFRSGEVWGVHVAWSGQHTAFAERLSEGWSCLGGGELLDPRECTLAPGESYDTPWLVAAYSQQGLDGLSAALHSDLRARPHHPTSARPVTLSTWEAVYFNQDLPTLTRLADLAAEVGAERYVLDDGWFGQRRHDRAGLGDWVVSEDVWPDGLGPLIDHVRGTGMQFGLWVEPEMVNPDSDLARAHPDWLLAPVDRLPPTARHQHLLNLAHPAAYAHVFAQLDSLLSTYPIDFLKWDHNRDIVDSACVVDGRERPGVHAQTLAAYRLMDELRKRHPGLEIEACAGGGGRADLEVLERTERVWTSDCNDPLERQHIQRWSELLLPPELLGAHIGPPAAHTTGRHASLSFRAATALFGHLGIEWDLTALSAWELSDLAEWVRLYRELRPLLHHGVTVRVDHPDPAAMVHGVVSHDRSEAVFSYAQLTTSAVAPPPAFRLPGLDPHRHYRVTRLHHTDRLHLVGSAPPPWFVADDLVLPGSALESVGLPSPPLAPEQAFLLLLTAL